MKFLVLIPTCDRPKFLARLLRQIAAASKGHDVRVIIADDGERSCKAEGYEILATGGPSGARGWWRVVDALFIAARKHDWHFSTLLADDFQILPSFFDDAMDAWDRIQDETKIALNTMYDDRAGVAACGSHEPYYVDRFEAWNQGWTDMAYFAPRAALEAVGFRANLEAYKYDGRGSGVGDWFSRELRKVGSIWLPKETLVYHGSHPSVMHPDRGKSRTIPTTKPYPR